MYNIYILYNICDNMKNHKQKLDKRRRSFILAGLFVLFLILSFFSINNVYGVDNGIDTNSDIGTNNNLGFNSESTSKSIQDISNETNSSESSNATNDNNYSVIVINTGSNSHSSTKNNLTLGSTLAPNGSLSNSKSPHEGNENHFNDNYKSNNVYYLKDNGDNLDKASKKSTNLDTIDSSSFYSIFQDHDSIHDFDNYEGYYNDINDYINNYIALSISKSNSNLNGNGNSNNLINEVANLNFNKIDNDEDTSTTWDFQSSPKPIFTILFFIKIFMEHHDNEKEHLNSF